MANNIKINNPLGVPAHKQKGSGFVNLNKILQANVGNKLGQSVSQGIGQGVQQVQQDLGQVKNEFQTEADKNNLASDPNKQAVSEALKNIVGGKTDVTDDQVKQFGTFLGGQYTGPMGLDSTKSAQLGNKAQEVQGFGQALGSGGDKTRLLQSFAGKGPYTAGQSNLDSLLLGQGPQAKQQLAAARQQTQGLTQQVGRAQENANQIGQLRAGQAAEFGQNVRGQFGIDQNGQVQAGQGLIGQGQLDLQNKVAQYGNIQSLALKQATGQPLSTEEQQLLTQSGVQKIATGAPGNTYGVQATGSQYYTPQDISVSSVATPQQRAQMDALYKLIGKPQNFLGDAKAYNPLNPIAFNQSKYLGDVSEAKGQYGDAKQQLISQQKALTDEAKRIEGLPGAKKDGQLNIGSNKTIQDYYDRVYNNEKAIYDLGKQYGQVTLKAPVRKTV